MELLLVLKILNYKELYHIYIPMIGKYPLPYIGYANHQVCIYIASISSVENLNKKETNLINFTRLISKYNLIKKPWMYTSTKEII